MKSTSKKIDRSAISQISGTDYQKLRVVDRLLTALINNQDCNNEKQYLISTIELKDDVIAIDLGNNCEPYVTEQNKLYESNFSINSKDVMNSLSIFFDNWFDFIERSTDINFVFFTNTHIAKEKKVGALMEIDKELPDKPILELLIEKNYDEAIPFLIVAFNKYYREIYKGNDIFLKRLDCMNQDMWKDFLSLIEWNFEQENYEELNTSLEKKYHYYVLNMKLMIKIKKIF